MYFDRKDDIIFVKWAKEVKIRDHFICYICDRRGVELNAHHKDSWDWCVERRYDLDNGATICHYCHQQFHKIYGYGNNTEAQFIEFQESCKILQKNIEKQFIASEIEKKLSTAEIIDKLKNDLDGYQ